jgi:hypothetical protein
MLRRSGNCNTLFPVTAGLVKALDVRREKKKGESRGDVTLWPDKQLNQCMGGA